LLERSRTVEPAPSVNGSGVTWAYLSTLGLTIANPSTIISFAALVATLGIGTGAGFLAPALLVIGVFAGSATWWSVLAGLGAGMRARFTPRVVRAISTFSGLAMGGLGMLAIYSAIS